MNKMDLRSVLAKLHEIENPTIIPVNEANPLKFNFLQGLGAGGAKTARPRIDPTGAAHAADELVQAAVQNANTKIQALRRHSATEWAAAKAEGKTYDEFLLNKFPDTFAKLEKNPELKAKLATEFSKAADEIMVAIERGEDPRALWPKEANMFDKKSLTMSAMGHALLALGLLVANKQSSSSGSSSSANSIPANEIPWTTYLGMDPRQGDSLIRGNHAGTATWKVISPGGVAVAKINGPDIVNKIEKLAAMTPEERKKLAQAEPKNFEVDLYSGVPKTPAAPSAKAPQASTDKDADIGITTNKTKEKETIKKKKKEEPIPTVTWGAN